MAYIENHQLKGTQGYDTEWRDDRKGTLGTRGLKRLMELCPLMGYRTGRRNEVPPAAPCGLCMVWEIGFNQQLKDHGSFYTIHA